MDTTILRQVLAATIGILLFVGMSPALSWDRSDDSCVDDAGQSTAPTLRCFRQAIRDRDVRAILNDPDQVPGIADGRLNIEDMTFQLRSAALSGLEIPGGTDDAIHDFRDDVLLSDRELELLGEGDGFDVLKRRLSREGSFWLETIPPIPPGPFPIPPMGWAPTPENPNYLDILGFADDLHGALSSNVNGYAMRMRRDGDTVAVLQWNWSRDPGDAPALPWNSSRRTHIASISKFMSAIGLVHLLDDKGIPTGTPIINWLPGYWNPGANVGWITFEDLMNHLSGFGTGGSSSNWSTMQSNVQGGVNAGNVGSNFDYENMNFGLIRILIATIGGYIHPATNFGNEFFNDILWDVITYSAYNDYMQKNVFNPSGAAPTLTRNSLTALAYRFNGTGPGWNTGDFSGSAGGVGWHINISEILNVVRALRNGQIVGGIDALTILNQSWGLNSPPSGFETAAGRLYYKAGKWTDNINNPAAARTEQCFVMMMPDDTEVVVFVNSEIGAGGSSLTNIVLTTYVNNIVIVNP